MAIKIGMTPSQFWEDDPDDFWAYWDAYQMKKQEEAIISNVNAFNQGQYMMLAIAQCLQFSKHPKKIYPKEPFKLKSEKKKEMTNEEYQEIRKAQMIQMEKIFNSKT